MCRRYPRFGLKTLFVFVGIVAVTLTVFTYKFRRAKHQMDAVAIIYQAGGSVGSDFNLDAAGNELRPDLKLPGPESLWEYSNSEAVELYLDLESWKRSTIIRSELLHALNSLPHLNTIQVRGNGDCDAEIFSQIMNHDVQFLSLCNMSLTDEHCKRLASQRNLISLVLCGNKITDAGLVQLLKAPNLNRLDLTSNRISGNEILARTDLKSLIYLNLSCNPVRSEALELLKEENPATEILTDGACSSFHFVLTRMPDS